jgi:hypothetical protein
LTFGSTAGDGPVRGGRRLFAPKMTFSDLGECALGIQDELTCDVLCGFKSVRIDILEQHVVDKTDEWRNARDFLFAARLKKNPHAAFIDWTRPFHQKADFFEPPDLRRHMG